jgi:hypothetical protein
VIVAVVCVIKQNYNILRFNRYAHRKNRKFMPNPDNASRKPFWIVLLFLAGLLSPVFIPVSSYAAVSGQGEPSDTLSVSGPDTTISFAARDSLVYRLDERKMELKGNASVEYDQMMIEAPDIMIDYETSVMEARPLKNEKGEYIERPLFTDNQGEFEADDITYNFSTREGYTSNISSESPEGYYSGSEVTRLENGELLVKDGFFTTCPKDDPDIWFYSPNMRIIPEDRIVASPLIMYVRPVVFSRPLPPIPLIPLPYMVIPLQTERASGFLIPKAGASSSRGFYLSNLGYYWAINDYMDLRFEGDVALNGSWRIGERFRYKKRYLFEGMLEAEYEHSLDDSDGTEYDNWYVNLVHHHEFDPTAVLDLDVEYQGGERDYDINSIDTDNIVDEQTSSYASFSKIYDEGERGITLSYQGTQDLRTDDHTQVLGASYYQNRVYPFLSDGREDTWASRFSFTPRASAEALYSRASGFDRSRYQADASVRMMYEPENDRDLTLSQSVILEGQLDDSDLDGFRRGARIELPFEAEGTLFDHLYVNGRLSFSSTVTDGAVRKYYDGSEVVTVRTDDPSGFSTYSVAVDASTRLYGVLRSGLLERMTGIQALRHTFIPEISFTWNPDYRGDSYEYYGSYFDPDEGSYQRYNRFMNALYSDIPEENATIGLKLGNLLQAKVRDQDNPSGQRILQLLSFDASTSYNLAADSLHLSPLVLSASSSALSPHFLLSAGAMYDFYDYDPVTGERVDRLYADGGDGLLRFLRGFFNMSFQVRGHFGGESAPENARPERLTTSVYSERFHKKSTGRSAYGLPWQLRMSLYLNSEHEDPLEPAETDALLNTSARMSLSNIWTVGVNTGFDLQEQEFVFPLLDLYGDFGCWEMGIEWVPSGEYQSYFLQIGLKSPLLKALRFSRRGSFGS